jgi:hypothetical protein
MDNKLFDLVASQTPKFNDVIVNGLAVREMKYVEGYVDRIMRAASADFPPGLSYETYRRCTPQEEQAINTERLSGQSTLELARSDVYMVKYFFKFNGEELRPCYLNLPFVNDAGIIHIRGSVFSIAPVMADKAISVGSDNIFIPLNRDMLTFNRQIQHFYRNGERESVYVVWSPIYHLKKVPGRTQLRAPVKGFTTLIHYLFAKYGLRRTFAEFANATVEVGEGDEINPEKFPPSEWVICTSTQRKPLGVRDKYYVGTNTRLAIRKSDYNLTTMNLIGGFFYIADHFPQRVQAEYVDETILWRVLLGHLIFGGHGGEGKLQVDVDNHLKSLDGYLDNEAKLYLRSDDIYAEDIYMLFMYIIDKFSHLVTQSTGAVSSMYDKRLMILRYVLKDITRGINKFMYRLNSNTKKALTANDIRKTMERFLKPNLIMGINKGHGEVSSVSSPGDNKYFKITSAGIPQTDSSGGRSRSKTSLDDPANHLHSSIAEVGSFLTPGKSSPTGRGKLNPCLRIASDGLIVRDPDKQILLDKVQRRIQR